jgi:hypothetical protein
MMPIIDDQWVPPSLIISEIGFEEFAKLYTYPENTSDNTKAVKAKKEEDFEVPTTPVDAREGFKFGCDPEGFIFKGDTAVSAEGLIPGTKEEPYPLEIKGEVIGYSQVDGMAAEFNIPPVTSFKDFNRCIDLTIKEIEKMLPQGHELRFIPSVNFDKEVFDAAPECAKELGCQPDYNAWKGTVNPPPKNPDNPFLRTASGHLHIGWTEGADLSDVQHIMNCRDLVKQLDWYLGGWSVKIDSDPTRRQLYGRAGACRLKDYGVEYRVLSNFWVTSRDRRLAVWNRLQQAISAMAKAYIPDAANRGYNELLQVCINESKLDPTLLASYKFPLISLTPPSNNKIRRY